jgi:hypothetical protein
MAICAFSIWRRQPSWISIYTSGLAISEKGLLISTSVSNLTPIGLFLKKLHALKDLAGKSLTTPLLKGFLGQMTP